MQRKINIVARQDSVSVGQADRFLKLTPGEVKFFVQSLASYKHLGMLTQGSALLQKR